MPDPQSLTSEEVLAALDAARRRYHEERRAMFAPLGVDPSCLWPAARVFHAHSALDVSWRAELSVAEVEELTTSLDYKRYPGPTCALPMPARPNMSVSDALRRRRSHRSYDGEPLDLAHVSTLLGLGCGVTAPGGVPKRAAPSGGALYPLEAYAVVSSVTGLAAGLYHYAPVPHLLELVRPLAGPEALWRALPPGLADSGAQLAVVLSAVFDRTQRKYLERGYRFALLEAGHIAQNLCLLAEAQGLGSLCVGGFWDEPLNALLGVDGVEEAGLYCVLIGRTPASSW